MSLLKTTKLSLFLNLIFFSFAFASTTPQDLKEEAQPSPYRLVDIDDPEGSNILKTPHEKVTFPLSQEDLQLIEAMKAKVTQDNLAGLAAPQLNAPKSIIVYNVPQAALKWRSDVKRLVPLTVLVNLTYEPLSSDKSLDWEGCASGKNHYGKVYRFNKIRYRAQDMKGNEVRGEAEGFEARLLQHEGDHCAGKVCIDQYDPESPHGHPDEFMPLREEETAKKKREMGVEGDYFPFMKRS